MLRLNRQGRARNGQIRIGKRESAWGRWAAAPSRHCSIIELSKMLRESRLVMDGLGEVQCPSCGEHFSVPRPPAAECPAQLDYDCEVCCRPMVIVIDEEGGAFALGADDSFSV